MIDFSTEILFRTARSGGKGGQNVNKVETMAEARWAPAQSSFFDEEQKARLAVKLATRLNKEGFLVLQSSETRSQLENKLIVRQKLLELVHKALIVPKKRKPTKVPAQVIEKRLETKRKTAERKAGRRKGDYE